MLNVIKVRHRKKNKIIGRGKSARTALFKNQAASLIIHRKIKTTETKAKVLRSYIEKLVTLAKKGDLPSKRELNKKLSQPKAVNILSKNIAPKYKDRRGGYTRITKIGPRKGDGANIVQIEFVS